MLTKHFRGILAFLSLFSVFQTVGSASPVSPSGQFSFSGTVYVTQTEFLFGYYAVPTATSADQKAAILLPSQDVFGSLRAGEIVGVKNLLTPLNGAPFGPGPVTPGADFLLTDFITLPDGINIDLSGLAVSTGIPVCTGATIPAGSDVTCRAQAASPVILAQNAGGVTAILNLTGRAHTAGGPIYTPVVGKLAANFTSGSDATIAGLLSDFATNGFIETSFSANISTVSTSPEAGSFGLMLLGISGVCFAVTKRRRKAESSI